MPELVRRHFLTGFRGFAANWRVFVASMLILFASWVALELAVVAFHRFGIVPWLVLHLAFLWFSSGLIMGLHGVALQVVDGKTPELRQLIPFLQRSPTFLLGGCIYLAAVVTGLVLFLVPGIYVAVRYALFPVVLADRPASTLEAWYEAAALSHGRWWTVCRFLLAALVLNALGAALLGIGLIVTFPVSVVATAALYRSFQQSVNAANGQPVSRYWPRSS